MKETTTNKIVTNNYEAYCVHYNGKEMLWCGRPTTIRGMFPGCTIFAQDHLQIIGEVVDEESVTSLPARAANEPRKCRVEWYCGCYADVWTTADGYVPPVAKTNDLCPVCSRRAVAS